LILGDIARAKSARHFDLSKTTVTKK